MIALSPSGYEFIRYQEVLSLVAYPDGFGVWTCGYGHTSAVTPHSTCTPEQAEVWLKDDVWEVERFVSTQLPGLLQHEFDALVSMLFNVGTGEPWRQSTTFRLLRNGALYAAAERFKLWDKAVDPKTKQLVEVAGLRDRRARERDLFLNGVYGYGMPNAGHVR